MSIKFNTLLNLCLLNIIPGMIIHLVLIPIWVFFPDSIDWVVSLIGLVFNVIILPIFLLIVNFFYNLKNNRYGFFVNILAMLLSMILWNFLNYINWGLSNNKFIIFNPDDETIIILKSVILLNLLTILGGSLVVGIILKSKKDRITDYKERE